MQIENSLTTPYHHIFQVCIYEVSEHGHYTQDHIYNIFVDKETNSAVYTERDDRQWINPKHFNRVYTNWVDSIIANKRVGDLGGLLDL